MGLDQYQHAGRCDETGVGWVTEIDLVEIRRGLKGIIVQRENIPQLFQSDL